MRFPPLLTFLALFLVAAILTGCEGCSGGGGRGSGGGICHGSVFKF